MIARDNQNAAGLGSDQFIKVAIGVILYDVGYVGSQFIQMSGLQCDRNGWEQQDCGINMFVILNWILQLVNLAGWIIMGTFLWQGREAIANKYVVDNECCPNCLCSFCCW